MSVADPADITELEQGDSIPDAASLIKLARLHVLNWVGPEPMSAATLCSRNDYSMILSGEEIKKRIGTDIHIDPFDENRLNPNSYDLTLHNELLVYEEVVLDLKEPNRYRRQQIPESGLVLSPNQIYLGRTVEHTETHNLVPMIEGRSSLGRLGLFVHVTAGIGDVGFRGYWTLEMFAVQPIRIYPGIQFCQIIYHSLEGQVAEYESSKYQNNRDIQPSLLYREFGRTEDDQQLKFDFPKG